MERKLEADGYKLIAGVDEAGRGPLAGPVVAAACILPEDVQVDELNDSKLLSEAQRDAIYQQLTSDSRVCWAVAEVSAGDIDKINILQAAMRAMAAAVRYLPQRPGFVLVDGNRLPQELDASRARAVVGGDRIVRCISAASVIAKVHRDRLMMEFDKRWPQYNFKQHKGYPTREHVAAIAVHGPCPIHRLTFAPLKGKYDPPKRKT